LRYHQGLPNPTFVTLTPQRLPHPQAEKCKLGFVIHIEEKEPTNPLLDATLKMLVKKYETHPPSLPATENPYNFSHI